MKIRFCFYLLVFCYFALPLFAHADYGLKGYVYTRGVVEGDDGSQYWAEYNAATGLLEGHFPATDSYAVDSTLLMSALQYRVYVERWEDIKQEYKDAEKLADPQSSGEEHPPLNLSRAELLQTQFTILSGEGGTPQTFQFNEDDLQEDTRHIILRPPVNNGAWEYLPLFNNDDQLDTNAVKRHIVLAQMPINPDETIAGSSLSLLVSTSEDNMSKRVLKESEHNIGFLTSFVGGVEGAEEYDGKSLLELKSGAIRNDETEFTNPIDGAIISTFGGMGYEFFDVTDEEGKYSIFFAGWLGGPPCWIMVDMYSPVTIKMQSKSFNPRLRQGYPYYIVAPHYLPCNPAHPLTYLRATSVAASGGLSGAMAGVNMIAMAATSSTIINRQDYIVDMKVLAGQAEMSNEHLSRDASIDPRSPIDKSSDVLDPETQDEWAATDWTKEIEVGDSTRYRVDDPQDKDYKIIQNRYDFDGDGVEDTTKIGQFMCVTPAPEDGGQDTERLVDRTTECNEGEERDFKINETASNENKIAKQDVDAAKNASPPTPYYQAVYFEEEGEQAIEGLPDIVRLLDDVINDYHQGLVEFISKDDLRNTDIYVFRESTGDLLAERSGLANRDLENTGGTDETDLGAETDEEDNKTRFFYRLQMRGGLDGHLRTSHRFGRQSGEDNDEAFERWQTNSGMNPKFHERQADHIRPGEPVKVIAINRATGYIGTAKTTLNVKDSIYTVPSIVVPRIKMGPPNLKIWAERELAVEYGITKGEKREYLIGSEGAAETDDIIIKVYTEWLDQDGSALPAQLKDFGYTARLGKLAADGITIENYSVETEDGQSVRYFPINPGKNLQLVRVSEGSAGTQHLYVQVNGESYIRSPDFSGDPDINIELNQSDNHTGEGVNFDELGAGEAQLQFRPIRYVPILTPVWDEDTTLENELYFRQWEIAQEEEQANGGTPSDVNPFKPEPAYKWRYRPEYHFTVYDLKVKNIERVNLDEFGNETKEQILTAQNPIITSSDDLINFIFDLANQVAEPISLFSSEVKELVLALGEEEFSVNFGTDQTIEIENIAHLSSLDVDDFLTMRLYTNNDASNMIWEYAFMHLYILEEEIELTYDNQVYLSADDPTIELKVVLQGYSNLPAEKQFTDTIQWVVLEGNATVSPQAQLIPPEGEITSILTLEPIANGANINKVRLKAVLGSDPSVSTISRAFVVYPGEPNSMELVQAGTAYTNGGGEITLTAIIRDSHGNLVKDGTPVSFHTDSEAVISRYQAMTRDGTATAIIDGGATPGEFEITAYTSGYVQSSTNVQINNIDFENLPSNDIEELQGGEEYAFTIGSNSAFAEGAYVDIGATKGIIVRENFHLDENGQVAYRYRAPSEGGSVKVVHRMGANNLLTKQYQVLPETRLAKASRGFVVHGLNGLLEETVTSLGSVDKTIFYDKDKQIEATAVALAEGIPSKLSEEIITLQGNAGDIWSLEFDEHHAVNRLPIYIQRFYDLAWDEARQFRAYWDSEKVDRSSDTPEYGIFSAKFAPPEYSADEPPQVIEPAGKWYFAYNAQFVLASPAYSFWFKPTEDVGKILNVDGGTIQLAITAENRLELSLNTTEGNVVLQSSELLEEWYKVALGYNGLEYYLSVNDQVWSIASSAQLQYKLAPTAETDAFNEWFVLGNEFGGYIAGLRIYDWESEPLVNLSATTGTINSDGKAEVNVSVSPAYESSNTHKFNSTVGLHAEVASQSAIVPLNIVPKSVYDIYSSGLSDAVESPYVGVEDVSENLTFADFFPRIDQPLASLVSQSINPDNGLDALLISVFSWMKVAPEGEAMLANLEGAMRIFLNTSNQVLKETMAYYLAQSVSEADVGFNSKFRSIRTALVVWSEITESNQQAARIIEDSVNNTKDLWTWIRFITLPANGWESPIIPIPPPDRTCDQITDVINEGTPYEFSTQSCRASGSDVGNVIVNMSEFITANYNDPNILNYAVRETIASLQGADLELTKHVFTMQEQQTTSSSLLIPDAHAAPHAIPMAVRAILLSAKIAGKALAKEGGVNLANFIRNGTNSRFSPQTMLSAIVYLQTRFPPPENQEPGEGTNEELCSIGCKPLEQQVADNVNKNIALWFTGLALAKKGTIAGDEVQKTACMFHRHAHGAALEIVSTALYHAMYEFLGREDYKILAADPDKNDEVRHVPIYKEEGAFRDNRKIFKRKIDLVLQGPTTGPNAGHYWVELKSWAEITRTGTWTIDNQIDTNKSFNQYWDGESDTKKDAMLHNAHRQHVIDHIATSKTESILEYWDDLGEPRSGWKPAKHRTWVHVWKQPDKAREYWNYNWKKKKWEKPTNSQNSDIGFIRPAKSFIEADGVILDSQLTPRFKGLQRYLTALPTNYDKKELEENLGESQNTAAKYEQAYQNAQIGKVNSAVAPFTVANMIAIEYGDIDIKKIIMENAGLDEWKKYLDSEELTAEDIEELKSKVRGEVEKMFETVAKINEGISKFEDKFFPEWYVETRDSIEDQLEGLTGDQIREALSTVEFPEWVSPESICEIQ